MNISFNPTDMKNTNSFINVGNSNSFSNNSINSNASKMNSLSGVNVDIANPNSISGSNSNAYKSQGKDIKDMQSIADMESMTLDAKKNYMAIMSNCVSDEDFRRLQQDGFNPGNMEVKESVSIVDRIKAEMIKSGTNVVGYTDTIDDKDLESITGSKAFANELKTQFETKDIPLTEDNAKEIVNAYEKLKEIPQISEAGKKYLVENDLTPNVDNLYTANYSSGNDASYQGHGYYSVGNMDGYYAKKPETVDINELLPQVSDIIEKAGYDVNDEAIDSARWIIEKGIPFTEETFDRYMSINNVDMGMDFSDFSDHATDALSDGIPVRLADLSRKTSLREEAMNIYDEVNEKRTIKGRVALEEVRLKMTVEANLKLLRSGYAIDTAPMEELVKNLKEIEKEFAINLTDSEDEIDAVRKKNIYDDTVNILDSIRVSPISISLNYEETDNLVQLEDKASLLRRAYLNANESYESLMTSPRADLGDSIQKAFRNVDDILREMNIPETAENQRAVRILGYNRMDITEENINSVKEKDGLLTETIERLTPGKVLGLIRENQNPLNMSVKELNDYLKEMDTTQEDMMSYSKFLYKLEQSNDISENEREAFIGIYRLINQIEKTDFSSVGAIEATGAQFNFENILSAIRSKKHKNMDYKIDAGFSGVDAVDRGIASITTQIAKGQIKDTKDLRDLLDAVGNQEAIEKYEQEEFEEIRASFKSEDEVILMLQNTNTPLTAQNLANMNSMLNTPSDVFKKLKDIGYKRNRDINLESKKAAQDSYEAMTEDIKDYLKDEVLDNNIDMYRYNSMDVKKMADMYQYINFLNYQSGDENFEIPADINGEVTAINLKVIHSKGEASVAISFESESFGKVASQFSVSDKGLSGYCSCSKREGVAILNERKSSLIGELEADNIKFDNVNFIEGKDIDLTRFQEKVVRDKEADTDVISTDDLYRAAKAFIAFVKDAAGAQLLV